MPIKLANNASGTLATAINATDTGVVLRTGDGAQFPALGAGEYFYATITSSQGTQEIVKATARVGDTLTVVRAQEGTISNSFAADSRFELRVTAAAVNDRVTEAETYALSLDTALRANLAASSGSSLVGFLQSGTSAVPTTVQAKLRERVSVLDFGADPTGASDSTAAFTAAIATGRVVFVPVGRYRVDSPVATDAAPAGITMIEGETEGHIGFSGGRVEIDLANNTSYFGAFSYNFIIKNILFDGGVDVIHHTSQGIDGNVTKLIDVCALNFSGIFWKGYTAGNGSHISWVRPQLVTAVPSAICYSSGDTTFDNLLIQDGWIETQSDLSFFIRSGRVSVNGTRFIPYTRANSFWFQMDDSGDGPVTFYVADSDFGGESGRQIAKWNSNGGVIHFQNVGIFGVASGVAFTLVKAPDAVRFDSCQMSSNPTDMFRIDAAMTAENQREMTRCVISVDGVDESFRYQIGGNITKDPLVYGAVASQLVDRHASDVFYGDLVATGGGPWVSGGSGDNVTLTASTATDVYGVDVYGLTYLYGANGGSNNVGFAGSPGLSGLANGDYTFEMVATVTGGSGYVMLVFADALKMFWVGPGSHRLCFPKRLVTGHSRNIGFYTAFTGAATLGVSRLRVFKGFYSSRDHATYADAAPTSVTLVNSAGDRIINSVPTVGQPKAWVCTVAGAPGTWVSEGNL